MPSRSSINDLKDPLLRMKPLDLPLPAWCEIHMPGPVSPLVTEQYFRQTASMARLLNRQSKHLLIFVRKLLSLPMERHCELAVCNTYCCTAPKEDNRSPYILKMTNVELCPYINIYDKTAGYSWRCLTYKSSIL